MTGDSNHHRSSHKSNTGLELLQTPQQDWNYNLNLSKSNIGFVSRSLCDAQAVRSGGRAVGVRAAVHSLASEITLIKSIRTARALSPVGQSSTSRAENNTLLFTDLSLSTFVFPFVQNEVNNGRHTCSSVASLPVGWLHQVEPYSSESCLLSTSCGKR